LYLYYFEQQMEDIDPTVTLPYWDWTLYRDDVLKSIEDMKASEPKDNGTVPRAYRCWVDETMLNNLKGKIPDDVWSKLKSVAGQPFNSANRLYDAAKITYGDKSTDDLIIAALENVNPLWHRYRWPGGNKDIIFEAYPTSETWIGFFRFKTSSVSPAGRRATISSAPLKIFTTCCTTFRAARTQTSEKSRASNNTAT